MALASEYLSQCRADAISQGALGGALALMEGAKFDQTNGGGEFGLIQGGFQTADGVGLADANRHAEHVFSQARDVWTARPPAAQEHAGANVIEHARLLQVLTNELKDFFQPNRHDAAKVLQINLLW